MAIPEEGKSARVVSLEEQIACVERELEFRSRVYPRWVADGKLKSGTAALEMERMRAVLLTIKLQKFEEGRSPVTCPKCQRVIPVGVVVTCAAAPCGMLVSDG